MGSKHSVRFDATPGVSDGALRVRQSSQRSNLAFCLVPLLLLGASCAGAAIQRQVLRSSTSTFGNMTRSDACKVAGDVFEHLLGTQPTDYDTSMQSAYSVRRHAIIREWSVLCSTPDGQYLLRINADTRRVYAINRMDDIITSVPPGETIVATNDIPESRISHNQAEARAREYIGLIGIQPRTLTPILPRVSSPAQTSTELAEPEWNFTFENASKQKHNHLVTISVRSTDGRLEHLWNPVLSL